MDRSRRQLSTDIVINTSIFKNNQITLFPSFIPSCLKHDKERQKLHSKNQPLCLRYEGKTGEKRNFVKDTPLNNHIKRELSPRPFY